MFNVHQCIMHTCLLKSRELNMKYLCALYGVYYGTLHSRVGVICNLLYKVSTVQYGIHMGKNVLLNYKGISYFYNLIMFSIVCIICFSNANPCMALLLFL